MANTPMGDIKRLEYEDNSSLAMLLPPPNLNRPGLLKLLLGLVVGDMVMDSVSIS